MAKLSSMSFHYYFCFKMSEYHLKLTSLSWLNCFSNAIEVLITLNIFREKTAIDQIHAAGFVKASSCLKKKKLKCLIFNARERDFLERKIMWVELKTSISFVPLKHPI